MESHDRTDHGFDASDAKPDDDDSRDYKDLAPGADDTAQDPVEDPDASREPGPGRN